MDFFCVRRHIGLFLIFWMSLSKHPSDAKRNETGGGPAGNAIAPGFNPCSRLITALVSPFHF
jgi:hypothetical protein